tara:strand:- start:1244 stop:1831 length:588 start_codon:yes stop_codon:yes gene_type:complete
MAKLPLDVQAAIRAQVPKLVKKKFRKSIDDKFKDVKKDMINEFMSHPVTQELLQGPDGVNISGTLNGVTNLYAFIGFDDGDSPVQSILDILEDVKITKDVEQTTYGVGRKYDISMPTAKDIFSVTPMPWATGRSWARGIETGISGLGYLLRKSSQNSRSGVAIQSNNKVRSGRFKNVQYISALIKKYEKRFDKLK